MAPTEKEEEGLQMVIAEDEEAEDGEHPEEEGPATAPAPITCAGTAKSKAISKKSATPGSKPELHRWTPVANHTRTHRRWRRRIRAPRPRLQAASQTCGHLKTTNWNP